MTRGLFLTVAVAAALSVAAQPPQSLQQSQQQQQQQQQQPPHPPFRFVGSQGMGNPHPGFKNFHVPRQKESKAFRTHYEEVVAGSFAPNPKPLEDQVKEALNKREELQKRVSDTLSRVNQHGSSSGETPTSAGEDSKSKNEASADAGTPSDAGAAGHPDFYDFDFYKEKCDEERDAFGFMCSEYVFAGEYTCAELIHQRGYKDCHCACQDAYTEAPRERSGSCPATCAISGHTCNDWLEVYKEHNEKSQPLRLFAKDGKQGPQQPSLSCARMERVWACDCSGCSGCNADDDQAFKTGDSSQAGSRVPPPHLTKYGLDKRKHNAASTPGLAEALLVSVAVMAALA